MESNCENVLPWVVDDVFLAPVHINVGGTPYTTTLKTLTRYSDSKIAKLFNRTLPITIDPVNRGYFLDVDGSVFSHILNFLRYGKLILPDDFNQLQLLKTQAEFFEIKEMIEALPHLPDEERKTSDSEEESVKNNKSRQRRRKKKSSDSEVMVEDGSGDGRKVVLKENVTDTSGVVKGGSSDGGKAVLEGNVAETIDVVKGGSGDGRKVVLEGNLTETSDVVIVQYHLYYNSPSNEIYIYSLEDIILEEPNPRFNINKSKCGNFIKRLVCTVDNKYSGNGNHTINTGCIITCTLHIIRQLLNKGYTICSFFSTPANNTSRACEFVLVQKS